MTDPVKGISGTQGTSAGGSYSGGGFSGDHKKRGADSPKADLIEISRDARERSIGRKKKGILEYLKELFR
jgi:hypothetical protein